jgi:hypothetical protein
MSLRQSLIVSCYNSLLLRVIIKESVSKSNRLNQAALLFVTKPRTRDKTKQVLGRGSTQHLTKMSTRNLPWRKDRPAPEADNLTAICEPTVQKMWEPRPLTVLWGSMASYRDCFTFLPVSYRISIRLQQIAISRRTYDTANFYKISKNRHL